MNPSKTQVRNLVLILLLALVLTLSASAPENWYNPDSTAADVNHGIDYVQSLASTNSEDFYTNTSGICIVGAIGENTSRVLYQWYRNNQSLYEYTYGNSTENEVLYLNFDEGEGNIAYDKSGKGNDGILNDSNPSNSDGTTLPQWVTGRYGKALNFDGLDDKVKCTISGATGFSSAATSLWIKTTDSDTTQHIANVIYTNVIYLNRFVAGKFIGIWDGSSGNNDATQVSITTINDGTWHHIASSNDGSTTKIYVDGVEENSYSETFAIPSSTACSIGSNIEPSLSSPGHFLNGTIDEVLIYDRVLSNSEIRNQYLSGPHGLPYYEFSKHDEVFCSAIGDGSPSESTKTNSLVAYWNFDGFAEGDSGTPAIKDNGAFATDITKVNNGTLLGDTVLLMHFEDTNGNLGATVTDESGYGNDGTLGVSSTSGSNPTYTTGISGTGLSFDGVNDYVDAGNDSSLLITGDRTLELWVTSPNWAESVERIPLCRQFSHYIMQSSSNRLQFNMYGISPSGSVSIDSSSFISNEWYHVVGVYEIGSPSQLRLYVNGHLENATDVTGTPTSDASKSLLIGAYLSGIDQFNGSIDEVAIYSRALTAGEIQNHYTNKRAKFINYRPGKSSAGKDYGFTALDFDGLDDVLNATNTHMSAEAGSIELWFDPDDSSANYSLISAPQEPSSQDEGLVLAMDFDGPAEITDGLVGWWRFDNDTGHTDEAYGGAELANPAGEDSLVLYMKFNNDTTVGEDYNATNASLVYDYSGNGNHGNWTTNVSAYTAWSSTGGKFNGGIRFDGDGDYVTGAAGSTLQFGSSDFAIEGWFYSTSNDVGYQGLITFGSTADSQGPVLYIETNNALTFATSNTGSGWTAYITSSTVPSINTWHHIAATRIGSSLKLYMDGTSIEVTQSGTPTTLYASNTMWIGWYGFFPASGQRFFNGTIDDVRIYKGRALSNETIAKHAGNWLMDYSGFNNYGVFDANTTGTTSPYAAYNQSARFGGGFEFDGLDDYMLTPEYNIASTTSSISYNAWIKREGTCNNYNAIISHSPAAGSNGPHFFVGNPTHVNELAVFSGAHYNYTGHVIGTDWTMVTMTFDGSVLKMYADGIEVSSVSTTITSGTEEFTIGGRWGAGNNNYYFNGTIDEVRIYNRTLSPAEINWSAGIMVEDLSWVGNDGFVYGNASYDYYSKFGGAFDFDGVDDYINAGNDTSLNITDAITIEAWIKLNAAGNHPMIVTKGNVLYAAWLNNIFKQPRFALASSDEYISLVSTTVLNLDQWYFLTFTYDKDVGSDNVNIFIDGILTDHMTGTGTINTSATADVYVGRRSDGYYFNGTIDSLRLYNRSLSEEEIRSHYLGTSLQKYQDALVFHTGTADLNYSIADWDEWHHAAATWEEAVSDDSLVLFMKFDNDSVVGEDYYAVEELSNPTAEEGLVLYMKFNNDSAVGEDYAASGSTVYDYSGDGNNGTHYGANYTTSGKIGGGFEFDGVDDYVDVGTKDTFNMEYFTLEFWIKRFGGTNVIAKTGGSAYSNMEWRFSSNIFYVYGASSYSAISGTIPTGTWTHVAAVYDGAPKLYINGVYRGAAASITKNNYNVPVTLGCRNNGGSSYTEYLNGTIDEVKIYSRALSGAEIARSAGTYVHDYSPEGNYGAMLNNDTGTMPTEAGKFDGGMQFDGLDDYINAGNDSSLDITDEITVEAWVYPSASMTDNAIVAKQSSPPGQQYALIIYAAGKARFQVYDTEYREALSDSSLSLNTWHHVVGVYDKSNAIVYVDSVKTVGEAFSGSAQSTSSIVSIGDYSTYDGTYAFNGTIDQVMIYSRALSAQEIQSHYLADYRGGIAKLYIDGVLASDTNFAPGGNDFSGNVFIGADESAKAVNASGSSISSNLSFDGAMDSVAIYSRALAESEVLDHYSNGIQKFSLERTVTSSSSLDFDNYARNQVNVTDEPGNVTLEGMCNGARCTDSTKLLLTFENYTQGHGAVVDYSGRNSIGVRANALKFDGIDDYVNINDSSSLDAATALTVEFWMKPRTVAKVQVPLSKWNYQSDGSWGFQMGGSNG